MATTPAKRACSVCGTLLADDSAYCPVCALQGAASPEAESISAISSELRFEHYQVLRNQDGKPLELDRLENVKIIDLGLAKGVTEDTLSIAGSFIGTPTYASPEQFAGLGADIRSDLYSLGVTLWEMLSGKPPFRAAAPTAASPVIVHPSGVDLF